MTGGERQCNTRGNRENNLARHAVPTRVSPLGWLQCIAIENGYSTRLEDKVHSLT